MEKGKEKISITDLYKNQISMSEWLEAINHKMTIEFREEDNKKRDVLEKMNIIIGLPYDKQVKMKATDIRDNTKTFTEFLDSHGEELCALRLIPKDPTLPKLRMRGFKVKDVVSKWFPEQKIECEKYKAEFMPHSEQNFWSTIFVVTGKEIFGEIIADGHNNLTQGFYHDNKPCLFRYDFKDWSISPDNKEALEHIKVIISHIIVKDRIKREKLSVEIGCEFVKDINVIKGYFETVTSEIGICFVDYNRILGEKYKNFDPIKGEKGFVKGIVGGKGIASGNARLVSNPAADEFKDGEILVCDMTSPDFLPLMKKACAIVTDRGGMLCHAAIAARELNKPCIVATGDATAKIRTGDKLTVDANKGIVTKTC